MSEISNEKDDFSEPNIAQLNTYFEHEIEDEIKVNINDDESIDDESPEVGWNSEDDQKYYSKTINIDTIEETDDELNKEEHKEDLETDELNKEDLETDELNKEDLETYELNKEDLETDELNKEDLETDELNKEENKEDLETDGSNKKGFFCYLFIFIHELIDSFIKPISK